MNPYEPVMAKVEEVVRESPTVKTLRLVPERPLGFATGQFVELAVPGLGEAPFTPSSDPAESDRFEISVMKVGRVTARLHEVRPGDTLGVRGPYGVGYPLDVLRGREIVIVGGGVGLAPLRSLVLTLIGDASSYEKLLLRFGARSPEEIIYKDEVGEWAKGRAKVDMAFIIDRADGEWDGPVGAVMTILDEMPLQTASAAAVVCGPPVMMKFVTLKLLELGFADENIYLSMEKNMSCGIGKCGHCRLGNFYCCKDGPVFSYDRIKEIAEVWD